MAHVELSLTESFVPRTCQDTDDTVAGDLVDGAALPDALAIDRLATLQRWSAVVRGAAEPSLVIDSREIIVGASGSCCELLGLGGPGTAVGRCLLNEVRLIDFTANQGELTEPEMASIPPLLAVTSGRLARGLLRVQRVGQLPTTLDAIAAPLLDNEVVVGSLTFFAEV